MGCMLESLEEAYVVLMPTDPAIQEVGLKAVAPNANMETNHQTGRQQADSGSAGLGGT